MSQGSTDRPRPDLDRLTVAQAAEALGISQDAVRKRISRGTIPNDKDGAGRVYVYLSPSETVRKTDQDDASKTVQDPYVRSLEDQIAFLRRELERKDAILLNLTERIPALEAPADSPPDAPQTSEPDEEQQGRGSVQEQPQTATSRRPWWRRLIGG